MRTVRFSRTSYDEFAELLAFGSERYGPALVAEKRDRVLRTAEVFLARHPVRPANPELGVCALPVTRTPFVLVYDYDDAELRIHLVIHERADRRAVDLSKIVW